MTCHRLLPPKVLSNIHTRVLNVSLQTQRRNYTDWNSPPKYDVVVIGGGIVGMAAARQMLLNHGHLKMAVLEKENVLAGHQSGHNSGVIHAGIYYTPGSLKAKLCVSGLKKAYEYCDANDIPYRRCGKLIVATTQEEVGRLDGLYQRGLENEVPGLSLVDENEIREIEPHCRGLKALHSAHTGIVDWGEVTRSYGRNFQKLGGTVHTGFKVSGLEEATEDLDYPITIIGNDSNVLLRKKMVKAKHVITCGGLYSDKLATMSKCSSLPKIIPFRGEYLLLKPEKEYLIKGNIYPLPDPRFPFLGVHFTPRIDGRIWLGPNAVLAFRREGYKLSQVSLVDLAESLAYRGLQKLVLGNLSYAFGELYRGINIAAQVKQLQRFVPELQVEDVTRGPSGVRAMAVDENGKLVDDFVFDIGKGSVGGRMLHVRNAPSPAATSSLAIGEMVAEKAATTFGINVGQ